MRGVFLAAVAVGGLIALVFIYVGAVVEAVNNL